MHITDAGDIDTDYNPQALRQLSMKSLQIRAYRQFVEVRCPWPSVSCLSRGHWQPVLEYLAPEARKRWQAGEFISPGQRGYPPVWVYERQMGRLVDLEGFPGDPELLKGVKDGFSELHEEVALWLLGARAQGIEDALFSDFLKNFGPADVADVTRRPTLPVSS